MGPLRQNGGRAFLYRLADEIVAVGLFAPQRDEEAGSLYSPRVIRDTFHRAIKCRDDLANWNGGGESFELHEVSPSGRKAVNDVRHWLRLRAPPAGPCEL